MQRELKRSLLKIAVFLFVISQTIIIGRALGQSENLDPFDKFEEDFGLTDTQYQSEKGLHRHTSYNLGTGDSLNTTLMGRWPYGPCYANVVIGNIAYFGNGGIFELADISDPTNPLEISNVVSPSVVYGISIEND